MAKQTLATRLTKLREAEKCSRACVADFCAMSREQIRRLETGATVNPTSNTLAKLAEFYNVTVSDLIGE